MAVPRTARPTAASSATDEWSIVIRDSDAVIDELATQGIINYTVAENTALFVDKSTLTLRGVPPILKIQSVAYRWRWIVRHFQRARFVQRLFGHLGQLLKEEKAQPTLQQYRRQALARLWTNLRPYTSKYKGLSK